MKATIENRRDETTYNGWKNYQTWNVFLWITNEEPLYRAAVEFMRSYKGRAPYAAFCRSENLDGNRTNDNVACWADAWTIGR